MTITIDYSPDALALIREQAAASNTTAEDFIRVASEKAARNAEYLAKLDRAREQIAQGNVVRFTDEEWEKFTHAKNIQ